jgi:hypothetical protein
VTKHKIIRFQLAPSGVALVAGGVIAIGALLIVGGYAAGVASSSKTSLPARPAPVAAPAPVPAVDKTPPTKTFSLRVTTVFSEEAAKAEQAALKEKEIESVVVALPPEGGETMYAVEIGPYASHAAAADASAALAEQKEVQTVIVPAAPLPKPPG